MCFYIYFHECVRVYMCESTAHLYIYTVYAYLQNHACMQVLSSYAFTYMTKGRFTFNFKRFQKHLAKFDPKCMMKSQICFIVWSNTWEFVSESKVPIHTSHTHFRSELRVSSFRIRLNKASILTSKTTPQQKRSFRFLHSHLFQIELCRYRPLLTLLLFFSLTHTHNFDWKYTYTDGGLVSHPILSPCISPPPSKDRFCQARSASVDVSRLFLLGFSDGATEVMELASTRSTWAMKKTLPGWDDNNGLYYPVV